MQMEYKEIPKEKFEFAQLDSNMHDEKLKTVARGYFADAMIRFKKNKSSVVAAFIILLLVLFSIVSPIISPYTVYDKDDGYQKYPPYVEAIANLGIGLLDGSAVIDGNETRILKLQAIAMETGKDVINGEPEKYEYELIYKGKPTIKYSYHINVNRYYEKGIITKTISVEEYNKIQAWQNESGIQVLYPVVDGSTVYASVPEAKRPVWDAFTNSNVWYQLNESNSPILDDDGNLIPAYVTDPLVAGSSVYTSKRIEGDDGSYVYAVEKSGSVQCRIEYYSYYQYKNGGLTPTFIFGTDEYGRDLFCAIGMGARFSLIFAVLVSAINLTIGAIYGAIQGYYGGVIDLAMDRVSDILSGVPFMVVATLFQLHLAQKVGVVPSFLFAFVLTGWIGMAALTRKQFYRFKNQEYVMAARTLGASDRSIMFKHILPNSLGTMVTSCALVIPGVISSETNLTYLKIIDLSKFVGTSIGELMASGQQAMSSAPHAMLFPALFLSLLLISFNLFGNGLRDAFNPSTRGVDD